MNEILNGLGHAEGTLMNSGNNITQIEASRPVCVDCENMMTENGVKTSTRTIGKTSRNKGGCR